MINEFALVEMQSASRTYQGAEPVIAMTDVSIVISQGEYVCVTGASGSGKSTLLNVIGLLETIDSGRYFLDGVDAADLADWQRAELRSSKIGFVFQESYMVPHLTLAENVYLPLKYGCSAKGHGPRWRENRVENLIDQVGLTSRAGSQPTTLSGGERQRAAIARALVNQPKLLLCDEPTGSLDTENGLRVLKLLESSLDSGATLVIVSHDPNVARRARTRYCMADGQLRFESAGDA